MFYFTCDALFVKFTLKKHFVTPKEKKSGYVDSRYAVTRYAVTPITNNQEFNIAPETTHQRQEMQTERMRRAI